MGVSVFDIIEITDDGLNIIFEGTTEDIFVQIEDGKGEYYDHQFVDLDGDGYKEIIEEAEFCNLKWSDDDWQRVSCETTSKVYKFDGEMYVEIQ